ncbi:hypothetical protein FB45DRAFT_1124884 [Roridomyces roridus]|uniref:Uncharacterized protein n=1 Tax=Roridomyces roridus TaxID=1738132 RepID=A0AAD7C9B4_9AGAR|nr:hypothetical protein FB45DRAFT_1124884 [Roridomyces roridus]
MPTSSMETRELLLSGARHTTKHTRGTQTQRCCPSVPLLGQQQQLVFATSIVVVRDGAGEGGQLQSARLSGARPGGSGVPTSTGVVSAHAVIAVAAGTSSTSITRTSWRLGDKLRYTVQPPETRERPESAQESRLRRPWGNDCSGSSSSSFTNGRSCSGERDSEGRRSRMSMPMVSAATHDVDTAVGAPSVLDGLDFGSATSASVAVAWRSRPEGGEGLSHSRLAGFRYPFERMSTLLGGDGEKGDVRRDERASAALSVAAHGDDDASSPVPRQLLRYQPSPPMRTGRSSRE